MCPLLRIKYNYFPFLAITREDVGVGARAGNVLWDWGPGDSLQRKDWRAPGKVHSGEPGSSDQSVHSESSLSDLLLSSPLLPHWALISSLLKHCSSNFVCSFTPIHTKFILKSGSPHPFLFFKYTDLSTPPTCFWKTATGNQSISYSGLISSSLHHSLAKGWATDLVLASET